MSNSVSLQHLTESGKSSLREHKAEGGTGSYVKQTLSAAGEMAFWGNGPLLTLDVLGTGKRNSLLPHCDLPKQRMLKQVRLSQRCRVCVRGERDRPREKLRDRQSEAETETFSPVQSLSRVRLFATPWTAACHASLSITDPWSELKLVRERERETLPKGKTEI